MGPIEYLVDFIARDYHLLEMTIADFSDTDLFVRPTPGANHAMWQLGHLAKSTAFFAGAIPGGKSPEIPADWSDKFGKAAAANDDPKSFPSRSEVIKVLASSKDAVIDAAKRLKVEDLSKPSPDQVKSYAPTLGHILHVTGSHWTMHVGQFQVIRRKLGKPVLF